MRNNRRTFLLGFAAATTLSAQDAFACSCVGFASPAEHIDATDVIFRGRVLATAHLLFDRIGAETTFEVVEAIKGSATGRVRIRHPRDVCCVCGLTYSRGETCWVFAHRGQDRRLHTSACSAPRFTEAEYREALTAT